MLKVQDFIRTHENWRELLTQAPYSLSISDDEVFGRHLVILKYNLMDNPDFSLDIVRECRGLILDADNADIVCFPFVKFFNYGEPFADEIDWKTSFTSDKLDGSLIKIVRLGKDDFLISTNGTIDAFKCSCSNNVLSPFKNFGDLAMEGMNYYGIKKSDFPNLFEEGYTYMFELTSPHNQVVVKFDETKMNFIGVRNNLTGKEIPFHTHALSNVFDTPKIYPLHNIDDCVKAAKELPDNNEGYVVCDGNFNRIKVKSPKYIQLHYMANNQSWSPLRVIDIIRANEISEYVNYFPQFEVALNNLKGKYDDWLDGIKKMKNDIDAMNFGSKKELAQWVFADINRKIYQGFAFKYFDGKINGVDEWADSLRSAQIVDFLGL